MKLIRIALFIFLLCGCASLPANNTCVGTVDLPNEFAGLFKTTEDEALLNSSIGAPNMGSLCQGKVYLVSDNANITVYRAWNSTNPNSRLGKWWAFYRPEGKVAAYRSDYEICYQWSPLDKLTHCRLKPNTKIVIGTGQSAACSQYLTYPTSAAKQIYLENPSSALFDCKDYDLLFSWKTVNE